MPKRTLEELEEEARKRQDFKSKEEQRIKEKYKEGDDSERLVAIRQFLLSLIMLPAAVSPLTYFAAPSSGYGALTKDRVNRIVRSMRYAEYPYTTVMLYNLIHQIRLIVSRYDNCCKKSVMYMQEVLVTQEECGEELECAEKEIKALNDHIRRLNESPFIKMLIKDRALSREFQTVSRDTSLPFTEHTEGLSLQDMLSAAGCVEEGEAEAEGDVAPQ